MANKHTFNPSISGGGGPAISGTSHDYEGGGQTKFNEDIIASQTHLQHTLVLDVSAIKSIIIVATVAMVLKFNSSGTPAPLLTLKAGVPYIWNTDSYDVLLLTADVTTLFVTTTTAGNLKIDAIYDVTP